MAPVGILKARRPTATKRRKLTDVEAQIAALEAELQRSPSSDDSSDESDADVEVTADGAIISSLASARIPMLPPHLLPRCTGKGPRAPGEPPSAFRRGPPPPPPRRQQRGSRADVFAEAQKLVDAAVNSEKKKIPFACRLCAFVGDSVDSHKAHRATDLHLAATELYKDQSYCRLCRAQCTSPLELKTHRTSKKHLERLSELRGE